MYYKKLPVFLVVLALFQPVHADTLALNPDHPQTYVVKQGDTLWDISAMFLQDPWRWPGLWRNNPQIENPHLIYPGDVLSLEMRDGQPVLSVQRGGERQVRGGPHPTVKLSPRVRESGIEHAIPTIPIDAIQPFLSRPRVVGEGELERAAYVLSSQDGHLVSGAGNTIYVRGIREQDGRRYSIFRSGEAYVDPDDKGGTVLGYEAIHVADAEVTRFGDPASLVITNSIREVLIGDRLVAATEEPVGQVFMPRVPDADIEGRIISVIDGVARFGQHQVVVLNRGAADGLEQGHVLGIFQRGIVVRDTNARFSEDELADGEKVQPLTRMFNNLAKFLRRNARAEDVELPQERAGVLMVFRPYERVSYALIMDTTRPVHLYDSVHRP